MSRLSEKTESAGYEHNGNGYQEMKIVRPGAKVTVYDIGRDKAPDLKKIEEGKYPLLDFIIGGKEVNLKELLEQRIISSEAPIAKASLGRKVGDIFTYEVGGRVFRCYIWNIEYLK